MIRYTFDNSIENRRLFDAACARLGLSVETIDYTPCIVYEPGAEIASFLRQGSQLMIHAETLTGPGSQVLDLIRELEDLMLNGEDPMGDYHGRNA